MDTSTRALGLVLVLFCGAMAGLSGGLLGIVAGDHPAKAAVAGGAAFAATVTLGVLILNYLTGRSGPGGGSES